MKKSCLRISLVSAMAVGLQVFPDLKGLLAL
jgi:hypothetical protein